MDSRAKLLLALRGLALGSQIGALALTPAALAQGTGGECADPLALQALEDGQFEALQLYLTTNPVGACVDLVTSAIADLEPAAGEELAPGAGPAPAGPPGGGGPPESSSENSDGPILAADT